MLQVANLIESLIPDASAAIHLIDRAENRAGRGVSQTLPKSFLRELSTIPLTEAWPIGAAVVSSTPVGPDSNGAERWCEAYQDLVEARGLGLCWVRPAYSTRDALVATATVFAEAPSSWLDDVLDIATSLLGMGVERCRIMERLLLAQSSIDQARDPAIAVRKDASLFYVNDAACRLFGYQRHELLQMRVYDLGVKASAASFERTWGVSSRRGSLKLETEIKRNDESRLTVEVTINHISIQSEDYQCVLLRDISAHKRTIALVRDSEERFALAARGANDGLWDWNVESNEMLFSPRWSSLLGQGEVERRGSPEDWWRRIHPEDLVRVQEEVRSHLDGESASFESEHRMVHDDGRCLWVLSRGEATRDFVTGKPTRLAGSLTNITKQKLAENRLRHDALHDELTGLPNRAMFMEHLGRVLARTRRSTSDHRFAVLFLDFDRFKRINDSLGHLVGDQLLVAVTRRLGGCLRPGDTVARLGGDEFIILLERVGDVADATYVAERIHQALREPFQLSAMEVFITASVGIAMGSERYERTEDILRDADTAMYRAKAAGRARHEVFGEEMHARAIEQLRLETELRRAVSRQEFRLLYQPIVSLRDKTIVGIEAFTRWDHPTRGLLAPATFLSIAEESGLIDTIGWWVFREACLQMPRWQDRFEKAQGLPIHVNLSDKQLFQPDLPARIATLLSETRLSAEHLVLDVPESVVMQKADSSVTILAQLDSLGVGIHLDDFGTGYSSLGYLHQFQIDTLKIDRSFIRHLREGGDSWITLRTIVSLASNLGMKVIAEGVETEGQRRSLEELACEMAQGSLFHQPLRPEELERLFH